MRKTGAIVQARALSTRLPSKVLLPLPFGQQLMVLQHVIRRLKQARQIGVIIIATTEDPSDDPIVSIAQKENVLYFRGSTNNVLSRYYKAALEHGLEEVVRITSDCPCIDPQVVDLLIEKHREGGVDYTSNTLKRTYPHGLDAEVFNFKALEKAYHNADKEYEKEHVTPYLYRNPHLFKINQVEATPEDFAPDIRITLDTEEDYALLCAVFEFLFLPNPDFRAKDIVRLFNEKPWLKLINKRIVQKKFFDNEEDELEEAMRVLGLQDLKRAREFISKNREPRSV